MRAVNTRFGPVSDELPMHRRLHHPSLTQRSVCNHKLVTHSKPTSASCYSHWRCIKFYTNDHPATTIMQFTTETLCHYFIELWVIVVIVVFGQSMSEYYGWHWPWKQEFIQLSSTFKITYNLVLFLSSSNHHNNSIHRRRCSAKKLLLDQVLLRAKCRPELCIRAITCLLWCC